MFFLNFIATSTAKLTGILLRPVNGIYLKVRQCIAQYCEFQSSPQGFVKIDESYFSAQGIRGKRDRITGDTTIVFGVLKRHGVYSEVVQDCSKATLHAIICDHIPPNAIIHSDGWHHGYEGSVDIGFKSTSGLAIDELIATIVAAYQWYRVLPEPCKKASAGKIQWRT